MKTKLGANPSLGWRSLLEGRKVLTQGIRWRVRNEKEIDIWKDLWIPRTTDFFARDRKVEGLNKVSQFINNGQWNEELILDLFNEEDARKILAIPLSRSHIRDRVVWHHTNCGVYLTSSGYKSARELKRNGNGRSKPRDESSGQRKVEEVRKNVLWYATPWNILTTEQPWHTFKEWWGFLSGQLQAQECPDILEQMACVLWNIWKHRNRIQFEGKAGELDEIWRDGMQLALD
ncbi:hypothetical protein LIER_28636 [Lithospermum erythrorhizon]|uniref:Uncharacterized protein n=1 Tax=Lithospermum erythrorhizon TaxID=34254 RepID=A0AAV3RGD3_LITER